MRTLAFFAALCAAAASADTDSFDAFVERFGKEYASPEARARAAAVFAENVRTIEAHNWLNLDDDPTNDVTFSMAVNEFTDMTWDEFRAARVGDRRPRRDEQEPRLGGSYLGRHEVGSVAARDSVDWSKTGAVSPVKNQGSCGSCWSFSTTGALEGAHFVHYNESVVLSEQELVDCDPIDHGCSGGLMDNAFDFLESKPLCTEESYPYHASAHPKHCEAGVKACTVGLAQGSVLGHKDVDPDDQEALMEAVSQQTVSIGIEADRPAFQFYHGGVMSGECGDQLDHGVLLVGYGTDEKGGEFWKIKNSWGPGWGEEGYIRISRSFPGHKHDGQCGLMTLPSYPVLKGKEEVENVEVLM